MAELSEFKAQRHADNEVDYFNLAIVTSLILHLVFLLLWDLNRRYSILHPDLFNFLHKVDPTRLLVKKRKTKPFVPEPILFRFADVARNAPEVEAPKNAKLYGAKSTRAANEKPAETDTGKAKIDGKQTDMIRVKDQPRPGTVNIPKPPPPKPAQQKQTPPQRPESKPQPPPSPQPPQPRPEVVKMAKATIPPVALPPDLVKPRQEPKPPPQIPKPESLNNPAPPTPRARPKTLREAREREATALGLAGRQMNQSGGVKTTGIASLNVLGTSFGSYDQHLSYAIQQQWFHLIENRQPLPRGIVVIKFRLMHDGRITKVETISSAVNDLHTVICQMSVKDPSPYQRWPSDMRRQLKDDHRDITVSFKY